MNARVDQTHQLPQVLLGEHPVLDVPDDKTFKLRSVQVRTSQAPEPRHTKVPHT